MPRLKKADLALSLLKTDDGAQLVKSRLAEIDRELSLINRKHRRLEVERRQLEQLANGRPTEKSAGARRGVRPGRVLKALKKLKAPSTKAEIAEAMGVREPARLTASIRELLAEGKLERTGKARGTRYALV